MHSGAHTLALTSAFDLLLYRVAGWPKKLSVIRLPECKLTAKSRGVEWPERSTQALRVGYTSPAPQNFVLNFQACRVLCIFIANKYILMPNCGQKPGQGKADRPTGVARISCEEGHETKRKLF